MSFAFAVPDVAASVTAFCLKRSIPLTCHQAGTTAEAPASMVGDVVRFVDVMRPVEMRKFHLFNLLGVCFLSLTVLYHIGTNI